METTACPLGRDFSHIQDGAGVVYMTVVWKEGVAMKHPASMCTVDEARCDRCGLCVEACLCSSVEMEEHGPTFHCPESCSSSAQAACPSCGCLCEEVCHSGAITCKFTIVMG